MPKAKKPSPFSIEALWKDIQDARNDPPATGREGDAPSANPDVPQKPTGPKEQTVEDITEHNRQDRVPENDPAMATASEAVTHATKQTEAAYGLWPAAAEACEKAFGTVENLNKNREIIRGFIIKGLSDAKQAALAVDKKELKNRDAAFRELRNAASDDISRYWGYLTRYAFKSGAPKAKAPEAPKAKAPEAPKAKAPEAPEAPEAEGGKSKSIDERALALVTAALDHLHKNEGFGFDVVKAATHLAAAKQIIGEAKKA